MLHEYCRSFGLLRLTSFPATHTLDCFLVAGNLILDASNQLTATSNNLNFFKDNINWKCCLNVEYEYSLRFTMFLYT